MSTIKEVFLDNNERKQMYIALNQLDVVILKDDISDELKQELLQLNREIRGKLCPVFDRNNEEIC